MMWVALIVLGFMFFTMSGAVIIVAIASRDCPKCKRGRHKSGAEPGSLDDLEQLWKD